ncbi:D-alanyl-D-alanine carboxypeptidase family protein [Actinomadura rifamycini]|uniref:D-alanyl-D-alanine carboxypeptidase family protein n=1 Tax=Actinomadura rifamycini TaxID=31962 RepID=UPI001FE0361E|nr:D-alanyl-D-alanine carboxypeptidase [Actinomadura rifamycini]
MHSGRSDRQDGGADEAPRPGQPARPTRPPTPERPPRPESPPRPERPPRPDRARLGRPSRKGGLRRAATAVAVPVAVAALVAPPVPARAEPGRPAALRTAPPGDPVGGQRLTSRGIVVDETPGVPELPKIEAQSYLVADGATGNVLAAKDAHGHHLPASTMKVLTAAALIPRLDADRLVRPSQAACNVEGTKVGLTPKMKYKVSDLFYSLLMMSANDSAVALAEANGGVEKTLADMNAYARKLNALDTVAGSTNGLDKDLGLDVRTQHTSAYDLVLILREGMKNADFREYISQIDHDFPAPPTKKERKQGKKGGYPIHTHNRLLPGERHEYAGMLGGKNGYTIAAKQTYVAAAQRNGHTIYIALMGAEVQPSELAAQLLDWGFAANGKAQPVGKLAQPVGAEKKADQSDNLLPDAPLASDDSSRTWVVVAGGAAGAVLAVGTLVLVLRRRRRDDPFP